jgi:hypothetical protein
MSQDWLCLQTGSGKEYKLAEQLENLGVAAYAPRYRKTYPRSTNKYNPIKGEYDLVYVNCFSAFSFFPTYLFASPEYYERRLSIKLLPLSLKSRVIGSIDKGFIETLQERHDGEGYIITAKEKLGFERGDSVIIHSEVYKGIEAIFLEHSPERDRIRILMQMLGTPREVEFRSANVRITAAYA